MENDETRQILEALERQGREIAERDAALRSEIADRDTALRTEIAVRDAALRSEIADRDAAKTRENAELRADFDRLRVENERARAESAERERERAENERARDAARAESERARDAARMRENAELSKEFSQLRLEQEKARAENAERLERISRMLMGVGLGFAALFVAALGVNWAMQENRGAPAVMQPPAVYVLPGPVHAGQGESGTAVPTLP